MADELWRELFMMIGGAAASLVGLLFIVMSMHFHAFREHLDYGMSATVQAARNNTFHLLTALVTAVVVLVPQPPAWMGAELIVVHLFGLRLPILFTWRHFIRNRGGFPISMIVMISTAYSLGAVGGVAMVAASPAAPYLVTASCTLILVRSVLTAWALMFERSHAPAAIEAAPAEAPTRAGA